MQTYLNHPEDDLIARKAIITAREIENQPAIWRKLAFMLRERKDELSSFISEVRSIHGLKIIFTGAGSSAFIGESMSMMLKNEFGIRSECQHTTEIVATPEEIFDNVPTLLVSYSRSGSSPESCAAIDMAAKHTKKLYNLVLVCNKQSVLADHVQNDECGKVVNIPQEASDQGFAMTCSVSCMALATWALFSGDRMDECINYIEALADSVEAQMSAFQNIAAEAASFDYNRIVYLGFGGLRGLAREGAVKSQELTNGIVSATYDTPTGFRHGPKTVLNDKTLVVMMTSPLKLAALYDYDMIMELTGQRTGYRVVVTADSSNSADYSSADYLVRYNTPDAVMNTEINAYLYSLIFLQILSFEKSCDLNITTDNPCPNGEVNRVVQGVILH